jgi:hypothetical protein
LNKKINFSSGFNQVNSLDNSKTKINLTRVKLDLGLMGHQVDGVDPDRGVHGSVRFRLKKPTEPNYINFVKY